MPYAAVRRPAAMLPFNVQLDDLVSMSEDEVFLRQKNLKFWCESVSKASLKLIQRLGGDLL